MMLIASGDSTMGTMLAGSSTTRYSRHLLPPVFVPEPPEREARMLEDELSDRRLVVAVAGDRRRVLGAERQERPAPIEQVIAAGLRHRAGDGEEDPEAGIAEVILDIVRALARERRHRARVPVESQIGGQRRPRILRLVLGDAVGDLRGIALRRSVAAAGQPAAHVHQHQAKRAADGHVRAEALAEGVVAAVEPDLLRDGAVDDQERRDGMRGGLDGVQVERRLRHRFDRGEQHREVFRPAARHDGVDGELLDRGLPLPRRQDGDHLAPVAGRLPQELGHAALRRRDDRQAVGPAPLDVELVDGRVVVVELERAGRRTPGAHDVLPVGASVAAISSRTTASRAVSTLSSASASLMPPSGCFTTASGRPGTPRFFDSRCASSTNSSVARTIVGTPRSSSRIAPWILHDVHDPQSELPTRAKSQRARSSSAWGDGGPATGFSRLTISVTP